MLSYINPVFFMLSYPRIQKTVYSSVLKILPNLLSGTSKSYLAAQFFLALDHLTAWFHPEACCSEHFMKLGCHTTQFEGMG